jgi:hypothetical protein
MTRGQPRRPGPDQFHGTPLSAREALLFEAGIKLGGIFHQYLGTPVASATAPGLARAIESAVRLQPYVRRVRVSIDPRRGGPTGAGRFAYRYLTAEMLRVRVELSDGAVEVTAELVHHPELRYPLMRVVTLRPGAQLRGRRAMTAGRSGGTSGRRARRTGPSAGSAGGPRTSRERGRSSPPRGSRRRAA